MDVPLLSYLLAYLIVLLTFFINGCEEFKIFTYTIFQKLYYFSVFIPIFCIGTIFLYCVIRLLISTVLSLAVLLLDMPTLVVLSLDMSPLNTRNLHVIT